MWTRVAQCDAIENGYSTRAETACRFTRPDGVPDRLYEAVLVKDAAQYAALGRAEPEGLPLHMR